MQLASRVGNDLLAPVLECHCAACQLDATTLHDFDDHKRLSDHRPLSATIHTIFPNAHLHQPPALHQFASKHLDFPC